MVWYWVKRLSSSLDDEWAEMAAIEISVVAWMRWRQCCTPQEFEACPLEL